MAQEIFRSTQPLRANEYPTETDIGLANNSPSNGRVNRLLGFVSSKRFGVGAGALVAVGSAGGFSVAHDALKGAPTQFARSIDWALGGDKAYAQSPNPDYIPDDPSDPPVVPDDGNPDNDLKEPPAPIKTHEVVPPTKTTQPPTNTPTSSPTPRPKDLCVNINGVQVTVPAGLIRNAQGECLKPPTATPEKTQPPIKTQPPAQPTYEVVQPPVVVAQPTPKCPPELLAVSANPDPEHCEIKEELIKHIDQNTNEHTILYAQHLGQNDELDAIQEGIGIDANSDGKTGIDIDQDGTIDRPSLSDQIGVKNGEPSLADRIDGVWSAVRDGGHDIWDRIDAGTSIAAAGLSGLAVLLLLRRNHVHPDHVHALPVASGGPDGDGGKQPSAPEPKAPAPIEASAAAAPSEVKKEALAPAIVVPVAAPAREAAPASENKLSEEAVSGLAEINVELLDSVMKKILSMSDLQLKAFTEDMPEEQIDKFKTALTLSGEDEKIVADMKPPALVRNFAHMYLKLSEEEKERIRQRRLEIMQEAGQAVATA